MKNLIIFLLVLPSIGLSQVDTPKKRSIFLEIGGSGGLGSINYEQSLFQRNSIDLFWRAGLSIAPIDKNNGVGLVFPLMLHGNYGNQKHKLDIGLGQGLTVSTRGQLFILTTVALGYKYQPENSRMFYKISYTPLISYLIDFQYQHWAGISIGYSFKTSEK